MRFRKSSVRAWLLVACFWAVSSCDRDPRPESEHSFDEIAGRVVEMDATQVSEWLGEPDTRERILLNDERWIWWNYTFLSGDRYPPEARDRPVHLEITFRAPGPTEVPAERARWRIAEPFGVSYRIPGSPPVRNFGRSSSP